MKISAMRIQNGSFHTNRPTGLRRRRTARETGRETARERSVSARGAHSSFTRMKVT